MKKQAGELAFFFLHLSTSPFKTFPFVDFPKVGNELISSKLKPLEYRFWRELDALGVRNGSILMGVSGGMDSVVLAHLLSRVSERLQLKLQVAHIHHGPGLTIDYRNQARDFTRKLAAGYELPFLTTTSLESLSSEAELREFRLEQLRVFSEQTKSQWIALAHHWDDLMETRLMRLIRGTDLPGLEAMVPVREVWLRPLLGFQRSQLEEYAQSEGLVWLEDPSNQDVGPLRNWIRHEWLQLLEQKAPGAVRRFGLSLDALVATHQDEILQLEHYLHREGGLDLPLFLSLRERSQSQVLVLYLRSLGVREYTRGVLREILKRLDSSQCDLTFVVGGLVWSCNAQRLSASHAPKR